MKFFLSVILSAGLTVAQEMPKVQASQDAAKNTPIDSKDAKIAAQAAKIAWLERELSLLNGKMQSLMQYYTIEEQLRQNDSQKPVDPAVK
jgi:TolA-binding protein